MSGILLRKVKRVGSRAKQLHRITRQSVVIVVVLLLLLLLESSRPGRSAAQSEAEALQTSQIHCTAWRQTLSCSPFGYCCSINSLCVLYKSRKYDPVQFTAGSLNETGLAINVLLVAQDTVNALTAGL